MKRSMKCKISPQKNYKMYIHCILHYIAYYVNYKLKRTRMKTLKQKKLYYYLQKLEFTKQQYPWKLYNAGKGSYFVLTYRLG